MAQGEPNYITPEGYDRMFAEAEQLQKVERPRVVQEVQDAAAQGDRSENAEYIYGKKRLREIDRRLNFLAGRLSHAQVVDPAKQQGDKVLFGARVELEDEDGEVHRYQVVGEDEVEPAQGKISWRSPLGRALLHKRRGDAVTFKKPGGDAVEYTVRAVRFG